VAVHDGLRQTGRAGGVEDVERVVEREGLEVEGPVLRQQVVPRARPGKSRGARVSLPSATVEVGHRHRGGQPGQPVPDGGHLLAPVDRLGAVAVAVDRQQHLRVDLAEAVEDAAGAELRRARGPYRPEAGGGQKGHQRLGDVGQVGHDPVAPPDAEAGQAGPAPGDLTAQLTGSQVDRAPRLGPAEHGDLLLVAPFPQHMSGVVEPGGGKPAGAGHRPLPQGRGGRRRRRPGDGWSNLEVLPDRRPEGVEVGHRPLPQGVVAGERQTPVLLQPAQVMADAAVLEDIGGRGPEDTVRTRGLPGRAHRPLSTP
jgi:hypothetical protein